MNDSIYCLNQYQSICVAVPCRRDDYDGSDRSARPVLVAGSPEDVMQFVDFVFESNKELTYLEWNVEFKKAGFAIPESLLK